MGKGDAKGFIVEASIRIEYRVVARDEEEALSRARDYFGDDIRELTSEAYDPDNYRVLRTVEGDELPQLAEEWGEAEILGEIEEG